MRSRRRRLPPGPLPHTFDGRTFGEISARAEEDPDLRRALRWPRTKRPPEPLVRRLKERYSKVWAKKNPKWDLKKSLQAFLRGRKRRASHAKAR